MAVLFFIVVQSQFLFTKKNMINYFSFLSTKKYSKIIKQKQMISNNII